MPEFHVVPNLARLQAAGVTILDLVNAIQASNIIDSPGLYRGQDHQLVLALVGAQAHDAEGLKQLTVKTTAGRRSRCGCGDVACRRARHHAGLHRRHRRRPSPPCC